ncbi:hypothetical protein CTI12_AA432950 [Artemisia annua]|uniref:Uncharacterized protein n=1 Tax=Artemisia annua TaxID=35608 RepID=A0A2U1M0F8_ARTAN|nr:hypothetical protein CTI12_AA432950 [Artemisia annua]
MWLMKVANYDAPKRLLAHVPVWERHGNGNANETSPKRSSDVSLAVSGLHAVSLHVSGCPPRFQAVSNGTGDCLRR